MCFFRHFVRQGTRGPTHTPQTKKHFGFMVNKITLRLKKQLKNAVVRLKYFHYCFK